MIINNEIIFLYKLAKELLKTKNNTFQNRDKKIIILHCLKRH